MTTPRFRRDAPPDRPRTVVATVATPEAPSGLVASSSQGLLCSLIFWGCLVLATVLYGAATLSVPYARRQQLNDRLQAGQLELHLLAGQVDRYAAHCEQLSRGAVESDSQPTERWSIALEEGLQFRLDQPTEPLSPAAPAGRLPPVVDHLSRSPLLRTLALVTAIVLLFLAFGLTVDTQGVLPATGRLASADHRSRRSWFRGLSGRYHRAADRTPQRMIH